jgi:hypothetical protein
MAREIYLLLPNNISRSGVYTSLSSYLYKYKYNKKSKYRKQKERNQQQQRR